MCLAKKRRYAIQIKWCVRVTLLWICLREFFVKISPHFTCSRMIYHYYYYYYPRAIRHLPWCVNSFGDREKRGSVAHGRRTIIYIQIRIGSSRRAVVLHRFRHLLDLSLWTCERAQPRVLHVYEYLQFVVSLYVYITDTCHPFHMHTPCTHTHMLMLLPRLQLQPQFALEQPIFFPFFFFIFAQLQLNASNLKSIKMYWLRNMVNELSTGNLTMTTTLTATAMRCIWMFRMIRMRTSANSYVWSATLHSITFTLRKPRHGSTTNSAPV